MRVVELPGGRWQVDVRGRLPNGKLYRRRLTPKVTSRSAALAFGAAHWSAVLRGQVDATKNFPTLAEFFDEFKAIHFVAGKRGALKPSQRESYESHWRAHLRDRFGRMRLNEITDVEIKRFAAELRVELAPKTVNNILTSLATMLARAREWHGLEPPKIELARVEQEEIAYWTAAELDRLVAAARAKGRYHLAVVLLGAHAGLRAGEILALRWDDVDFARNQIAVRAAKWRKHEGAPKSNRRRYVPMSGDLAATLADMRRVDGRVIRAPRVKTATIETLRGFMGAVERAAGFVDEDGETKGAVHRLRHTFGALLATRGVPLQMIQALMGHASFTTTLRYAHLAPNTLRDAIGVIGVLPVPPAALTVGHNGEQNAPNRTTNENAGFAEITRR